MGKSSHPRVNLTARVVDAVRPSDREQRIYDSKVPALFLRVLPSGIKSWGVTWGRNKVKAIGKPPGVTVDAARTQASAMLVEAAEHGAPLAVIEANKEPEATPVTLGEFVEGRFADWARRHQKDAGRNLKLLKSTLPRLWGRELSTITGADIEAWKVGRLVSGATLNRDLSRMGKVFTLAMDWGLITVHPLRHVKRLQADNSRVRYLSPAEEQCLRTALAARDEVRRRGRASGNVWRVERDIAPLPEWGTDEFTDYLSPMVLLAMNTGLRRGELFGLEWQHVNLPGKLLTVVAGNAKSGKARHLPLNVEALDVLTRWQPASATGLVFPSPAGGRLDNIAKSWEGVTIAAGLTDFRFHDLRHSFASRLVMAGVDLNTVRELLGHADLKMTLRYAHLAPGKLAEAVEKLL